MTLATTKRFSKVDVSEMLQASNEEAVSDTVTAEEPKKKMTKEKEDYAALDDAMKALVQFCMTGTDDQRRSQVEKNADNVKVMEKVLGSLYGAWLNSKTERDAALTKFRSKVSSDVERVFTVSKANPLPLRSIVLSLHPQALNLTESSFDQYQEALTDELEKMSESFETRDGLALHKVAGASFPHVISESLLQHLEPIAQAGGNVHQAMKRRGRPVGSKNVKKAASTATTAKPKKVGGLMRGRAVGVMKKKLGWTDDLKLTKKDYRLVRDALLADNIGLGGATSAQVQRAAAKLGVQPFQERL